MTLALDRDRVASVEEDVDDRVAVATGDDHRTRPQRQHLAGEILLGALDPRPAQLPRLQDVRRERPWQAATAARPALAAPPPRAGCAPLSATITGSTTTGASPTRPSAAITASTVAASPSIPTFTASTPMSPTTARTWATIIAGETVSIASTPTVFWAVIAVIAVIPCTPQRANAFKSAWMPAPAPESEPAIDKTAGIRRESTPRRLEGAAASNAGRRQMLSIYPEGAWFSWRARAGCRPPSERSGGEGVISRCGGSPRGARGSSSRRAPQSPSPGVRRRRRACSGRGSPWRGPTQPRSPRWSHPLRSPRGGAPGSRAEQKPSTRQVVAPMGGSSRSRAPARASMLVTCRPRLSIPRTQRTTTLTRAAAPSTLG